MKVCRICLSKDGRLYPITGNEFRILYNQLTGILMLDEEIDIKLPQWVCAECGLRLMSYDKLRQKSLRSLQILTTFLNRATHITADDINEIDREKNNLLSNYTYHIVNIDYDITESPLKKEIAQIFYDNNSKIEEFVIKLEVGETSLISHPEKNNNDSISDVSELDNISDISDVDLKDLSSLYDGGDSIDSSLSDSSFTHIPLSDKEVQEIEEKANKIVDSIKKRIDKNTIKKVPKKKVPKNKVVKKPDLFPLEELFIVQEISLEEEKKDIEKRKYSKKYTNSIFKCNDCFKGFFKELTYNRHLLRHFDKSGSIVCELCKYRFSNKSNYNIHFKKHKVKYNCKICNFTSRNRNMTIPHGLSHKGKTYQCQHCDKQFAFRSTYLGHLRIDHVTKYACEFFGFSFLNPKGLKKHKNLSHIFEKDNNIVVPADGPSCAKCNIKFFSDEAFHTHSQISHPLMPNSSKRNDSCQNDSTRNWMSTDISSKAEPRTDVIDPNNLLQKQLRRAAPRNQSVTCQKIHLISG